MIKRIFAILVCVSFMIIAFTSAAVPAVAANNDFYWKPFDKPYITFLFDDGRMPFTEECFDVFSQYDYPMTCAIIARDVDPDRSGYKSSLAQVLHKIQDAGGEILSHGYSHVAVTSESAFKDRDITTCSNAVYNESGIDSEFRRSYQVLTKNGFKVGGIIQVGCSNGCTGYADKAFVENITRRYYKYSNNYGISPQYSIPRQWPSTFNDAKKYIDNAISKNDWLVLSAHQFGSGWGNIASREVLIQILDYIKEKDVEVVNFSQMYEKFGVYSGPEIPSVEMDLTPYSEQRSTSSSSTTTENSSSIFSSKITSSATSSTFAQTASSASNTDTSSINQSADPTSLFDNKNSTSSGIKSNKKATAGEADSKIAQRLQRKQKEDL